MSKKKIIVFVHGFGAKDPQEYWKEYISAVKSDDSLKEYKIYPWGYPTHRSFEWWENLRESIKNRSLVKTAPKIAALGNLWHAQYEVFKETYEEFYFICHSMGGLIIKSWIIDVLERGEAETLEKVKHIAFYATPNNGASLSKFFNVNPQLKDIQPDSGFIEELKARWWRHVVSWKDKERKREHRQYNLYIFQNIFLGTGDGVVGGAEAMIEGVEISYLNGTHESIIKPSNRYAESFMLWKLKLPNFTGNFNAGGRMNFGGIRANGKGDTENNLGDGFDKIKIILLVSTLDRFKEERVHLDGRESKQKLSDGEYCAYGDLIGKHKEWMPYFNTKGEPFSTIEKVINEALVKFHERLNSIKLRVVDEYHDFFADDSLDFFKLLESGYTVFIFIDHYSLLIKQNLSKLGKMKVLGVSYDDGVNHPCVIAPIHSEFLGDKDKWDIQGKFPALAYYEKANSGGPDFVKILYPPDSEEKFRGKIIDFLKHQIRQRFSLPASGKKEPLAR